MYVTNKIWFEAFLSVYSGILGVCYTGRAWVIVHAERLLVSGKISTSGIRRKCRRMWWWGLWNLTLAWEQCHHRHNAVYQSVSTVRTRITAQLYPTDDLHSFLGFYCFFSEFPCLSRPLGLIWPRVFSLAWWLEYFFNIYFVVIKISCYCFIVVTKTLHK